MARPRRQNADGRTVRYELRLSEAERAALSAVATARGVTPADLLRAAFLGSSGAFPAPRRAEPAPLLAPSAVAALNRVGANLNQLARRANAGDLLQPGELPEALAGLTQCLDRIETLVMASIEP